MDQRGQWHNWSTLSASGLKIGRAEKTAQFPELNSMAVRHMRVTADGPRIKVEDLGSLNGVFLRVTQPIGLTEGARFRVGSQVLEFHLGESLGAIEPKVADDGEEFWCRAVQPLAYLDVLRPDGEVGFRYPITSAEGAVMGRESRPGRPVHLAFPGDDVVSGQHAQVRRVGEAFIIEDLNSRNGTFIRINGEEVVDVGDVLLVGRVLLRVVEQAN